MSHLVFLARVALAGEGKHSARSIRGLISTKAEGAAKQSAAPGGFSWALSTNLFAFIAISGLLFRTWLLADLAAVERTCRTGQPASEREYLLWSTVVEQKKKYEVSILLPAYNEAGVIGDTIERIRALYPEYEILVVDDGSTDSTLQEAMAAGAHVWPHPYNIGNGAAIKTGLRCAQGEWVVMMDADGQHRPEDIARLLEYKDRFDMVVGARTRQSETKAHRDLANWVYNRFASYVTKFKIEDLTSGFRLVRLSVVKQFIYLLPNTFSYPSTLTLGYLRSGRSVKYIPIQTKARTGKSKIKLLRDGTRFFLIITKIATLFSPFRVFLPISLGFFATGLCYYGYTFFAHGRFTNMSALLFNSAIIIFMIGLVAEQINQMRYDRIE